VPFAAVRWSRWAQSKHCVPGTEFQLILRHDNPVHCPRGDAMEIEGAAYLFGFAATAAAYYVDAEKESVEFLYLKGGR
jgi:hypothetical protein